MWWPPCSGWANCRRRTTRRPTPRAPGIRTGRRISAATIIRSGATVICPQGFTPQLNPFYVALPYNDVAKGGVHRPEASEVIPWFWEAYRGDGISVCKGRWVAIHHEGRVCYAQWEDVGPFEVDHWQYVFGNEAPRANRNKAAGIDLSPAVRDFLKLRSGAKVEWRFVEDREVPRGPWHDWSGGLALPQLLIRSHPDNCCSTPNP